MTQSLYAHMNKGKKNKTRMRIRTTKNSPKFQYKLFTKNANVKPIYTTTCVRRKENASASILLFLCLYK
jgi:hypothetical protein